MKCPFINHYGSAWGHACIYRHVRNNTALIMLYDILTEQLLFDFLQVLYNTVGTVRNILILS